MNKPFKVAYYLSRFPRLSETFILREMCALREKGVDVEIFS
ncbi:MAG: colanic acid biosynthesis glycosyltransferase WcaL, partial [Anaerolineae bacterium]|nr:colanic acid biosynthesis glycosyltransferase WcaL [Anaerolineae bacterium]